MASRTETSWSNLILLDTNYVLGHVGGDSELLTLLCRAFLEDLPPCLDDLRRAIARRNFYRASEAMFRLQSCLVVFGFGQISSTAQSLDRAIRNRRVRHVRYLWGLLQQQLNALIPQVQLLMLEVAPPTGAVQ